MAPLPSNARPASTNGSAEIWKSAASSSVTGDEKLTANASSVDLAMASCDAARVMAGTGGANTTGSLVTPALGSPSGSYTDVGRCTVTAAVRARTPHTPRRGVAQSPSAHVLEAGLLHTSLLCTSLFVSPPNNSTVESWSAIMDWPYRDAHGADSTSRVHVAPTSLDLHTSLSALLAHPPHKIMLSSGSNRTPAD